MQKDESYYDEDLEDNEEEKTKTLISSSKNKISMQLSKKQRSGVSAEAYGIWNKKSHFQPLLVTKTMAVRR